MARVRDRVRDRDRDRVRISLRLTLILTPTLTLNNDYTTLLISRLYCNTYKLCTAFKKSVFSVSLPPSVYGLVPK